MRRTKRGYVVVAFVVVVVMVMVAVCQRHERIQP